MKPGAHLSHRRKRQPPSRKKQRYGGPGRAGALQNAHVRHSVHETIKAPETMSAPNSNENSGMTLLELLVVLAVITVLAALILPLMHRPPRWTRQLQCLNNLKQTGLAFRIWEGDNQDRYPMAVPRTNGGSMEFMSGPNAFRTFQVMSNELSTPKNLFCPEETDAARFTATNFEFFCNSNISFFVGVDTAETNPMMILSGDHSITNGIAVKNGILDLMTNKPAGWSTHMHDNLGNILLADGSVRQVKDSGLQDQIANTGVATNRLLMPIFRP